MQITETAVDTAVEMAEMPTQTREASIVPATFDEVENSVEVVWTTGARRRAYDWWTDQVYDEELAVTTDAVDMTRFEAGTVQALDGHRVHGGVGAILGIAARGWIDGEEGRARIRLSVNPDNAGKVADIKAGIIRSISFGYSVERYEVTPAKNRTDGAAVPLYRAVRWTPQEISFVTVPADPHASTRSLDASSREQAGKPRGMPCEIVRAIAHTQRNNQMDRQEQVAAAPAVEAVQPAVQPAAPVAQPAADFAQRAADITELCVRHGAPQLAAGLLRANRSLDEARAAVLQELVVRDAAAGGHRNVTSVQTVADEHQTRMDGIAEAMLHRVDSRTAMTDNGRRFRGMALLEIGREMLESGGVNTRGMDRMSLATRVLSFRSGGMLATSDFASIAANVANKRLRAGYEENPGTYTRWARRAPNAPDFKSISVTQLSAMPDLLKVNEHGEFKYGAVTDGAEAYALLTYGRIVSLTRQAIINDDLRAFDRMVSGFGSAAARLENRTVYAQLTANAAMADTVALFHATHANLGTGGGSALQFTSLAAARTAMRLQKGLANEELNLAPAYIIVPAALEQTAYQLTSSNYVPATKAEVNEFRQGGRTSVEPIVEPILDANSATAWYAAAMSSQVDTVEYCYLDGAEGPVIESEMGFEVDGMSLKCRLDFAAKVVDHRGLYKANGA